MSELPKTICIDARLYGYAHTGIGRYVMNLIKYLPQDKRLKPILIVSQENQSDPQLSGFTKHVARFHPYHPLSQLEMLKIWYQIRPDLLHVPHFAIPILWPGKLIITIHDLIKNLSRGKDTTTKNPFTYRFKYFGYRMVLNSALRRAEIILVPAKYWRDYLLNVYQIAPQRVVVTYEGVDDAISKAKATTKFSLPKPLVIHTGNLYPHKNVPVLLQTIKLFNGEVKLALVCARSVFTDRIEKLVRKFNLEKDVYFLGRLSDEDLASLYAYSDLYVFPSLIEGFGLPGLEAMSRGLPVIAARASCLPEIYKTAAVYFDPKNPKDLQQKIRQVLSNEKLRTDLKNRGYKLVNSYSWQKMARSTWNQYRKILL